MLMKANAVGLLRKERLLKIPREDRDPWYIENGVLHALYRERLPAPAWSNGSSLSLSLPHYHSLSLSLSFSLYLTLPPDLQVPGMNWGVRHRSNVARTSNPRIQKFTWFCSEILQLRRQDTPGT